MREGIRYPNCFDPYLLYAISTDFRYFEFFDEKSKLFFLVEFKRAEGAKKFADEMNSANALFSVVLVPANGHTRYATVRSEKAAVVDAVHGSNAFRIWQEHVSRVELSLPLKSSAPKSESVVERWKDHLSPGRLLIGILDDGCPFAAAHFLKFPAGSAPSTRVRAIWDQNAGKQPVPRGGSLFGRTLSDFTYGLEFLRQSTGGATPQIGLDDWIGSHLTPTGSIDEDGCYADAGFTTLAAREAHGAHVMDVLAGRFPTSSRISQNHRDPPSWNEGTDRASGADIVFVQFPDNCIRDATGVWLKAYVVDGIRYILSHADPDKTDVVINISYGPTTGPHDGTAELEAALTALVAEFNGKSGKPRLEIALAAGNSYLSEGHVAFTGDDEQAEDFEWTWRLLPDNPVQCFAEIWMDTADADGVCVTLTSPSGHSVTSPSGVTAAPADGVLPPSGTTPLVSGQIIWGNDSVWQLAVGPTIVAPGILANEHGDYTIKVTGVGENAEVHAYVARSDPNMGVRTGAKRSYFVDPEWERTRSAEAACTRVNGEFDKAGSLVSRFGTLNGIATAKKHRVHVAGGYVLADGRKSPYSSAGPPRHGHRVGPDYVLPCDESYALQGIRAGGTRSGIVFRLVGTSAAAPQLARWVANSPLPAPTDVPSPNDTVEIEKRGGGDLAPP
jgi:hypothetical protein